MEVCDVTPSVGHMTGADRRRSIDRRRFGLKSSRGDVRAHPGIDRLYLPLWEKDHHNHATLMKSTLTRQIWSAGPGFDVRRPAPQDLHYNCP